MRTASCSSRTTLREPPELAPDEVVARLEAAGLAGMGGAGFPAWRKWQAVRAEPGPRVVIVNADEGEPGTIKDRYVMELRPQLLLEGLAAAMRFCETDEAYVYLREEYATSRARLQGAIEARGLPVQIVVGAGSYVCGEETAMLESMEGRRGMPRLRPPFPAQRGYLGRPTLINNVETLVHVARILRGELGAGAAVVGLGRGARARLLRGAARRDDAAAGRRLRRRRDGGDRRGRPRRRGERDPPAGRARRAADARGARGVGRGPGLGRPPGLSRPRTRCCGSSPRRCASSPRSRARSARPCRIGNRALHHVAEELQEGRAAMTRAKVDEWLEAMAQTSICGLGQASPFPVQSVFRHWPELVETLS